MSAPVTEAVLSSSEVDSSLQLWDLRSGTLLASYKQHASSLPGAIALAGTPKAGSIPRTFFSIPSAKPVIQIYAWHKDQPLLKFAAPERLIVMATSKRGTYCAAATAEGRVYLWHIPSGELLATWSAHYRHIRALVFTDDDTALLTGGDDATVNVWTLANIASTRESGQAPRPHHSWADHALPVTQIALSTGMFAQARAYTASLDHTVKIWSLATGQLLGTLLFPSPIVSLALGPADLSLYVSGPSSPEILRADLHRHRLSPAYATEMRSSIPSAGALQGVGLDDSEQSLPYASYTATSTAAAASSIQITSLAISLDGTLLVGGASDGAVRVWDTTSRQLLRTYTGHKGSIASVHTLLSHPADLVPRPKTGNSKLTPTALLGVAPLLRTVRVNITDPAISLTLTGDTASTTIAPVAEASVHSGGATDAADLEQQEEQYARLREHHARVRSAVDVLYQGRVSSILEERRKASS